MKTIVLIAAIAVLTAGCGAAREVREAKQAVDRAGQLAEDGTTGDKELDAFVKRAEKFEQATFKATYKQSSGSGEPTEMVLAQKDVKSRFETGGQVFIDDTKHNYMCVSEPDERCLESESASDGTTPAYTGFGFAPGMVIAGLQFWAVLPGLSYEMSTRTVAGEKLDCATMKAEDQEPYVICITEDGVLGYQDDGDNVIELVDYSTAVDDDEFEPPYQVMTEEEFYDYSGAYSDDAGS